MEWNRISLLGRALAHLRGAVDRAYAGPLRRNAAGPRAYFVLRDPVIASHGDLWVAIVSRKRLTSMSGINRRIMAGTQARTRKGTSSCQTD